MRLTGVVKHHFYYPGDFCLRPVHWFVTDLGSGVLRSKRWRRTWYDCAIWLGRIEYWLVLIEYNCDEATTRSFILGYRGKFSDKKRVTYQFLDEVLFNKWQFDQEGTFVPELLLLLWWSVLAASGRLEEIWTAVLQTTTAFLKMDPLSDGDAFLVSHLLLHYVNEMLSLFQLASSSRRPIWPERPTFFEAKQSSSQLANTNPETWNIFSRNFCWRRKSNFLNVRCDFS